MRPLLLSPLLVAAIATGEGRHGAAWNEHSIGLVAYAPELDIAPSRVARVREHGCDKPLAWGG